MDADSTERRRERNTSRRDRWSMNSQRLEQIVAELMRPISDIRRSFDLDLCGLLEEYLTEAGVHALEQSEREETGIVLPNFAELALVLQQSANVYGRKVDFLYQHVLTVSESLQQHDDGSPSPAPDEPAEGEGGAAVARRRRRPSVAVADFLPIELEAWSGAAREPEARVPPTLSRQYVELEPRPTAVWERPLADYRGEPIGLPADFYVTMRLQNGLLVEELMAGAGERSAPLRAISLHELQAAILAHCGPSPAPRTPPHTPPHTPPPRTSTPLPAPHTVARTDRKRKNDTRIDDVIEGSLRITISQELAVRLAERQEYSVARGWIARVTARRTLRLLHHRHKMRKHNHAEFRGFDMCEVDIGGFPGWGGRAAPVVGDDSDDDGFFEQSSLGDSDMSRGDDDQRHNEGSWRTGLDVRSIAERVLTACCPPRAQPVPCRDLLVRTAPHQRDVSTVLLATLFLANAGNVEIVPGAPLSVNSFSVRVLSTDPALYCAAMNADAMLHARADTQPHT